MPRVLPMVAMPGAFDEPITLAEARAHVRVDAAEGESHPDDSKLLSMVTAARQAAEQFTERLFTNGTYELLLDELPCIVRFPVAPVGELLGVQYIGEDGQPADLAAGIYRLYAHPDQPGLYSTPGVAMPSLLDMPGAVRVRFKGGHGPGNPVPRAVVHAMLLTLGHLYDNREEVVTGTTATQLPEGAKALLWPYRRGLGV
ncbi:head-tail connector protein [Pseudorhodoferax sp. Leaf274]|uniref:head-tail connector protein n=1 Tax=Pseudorhodoferax sp. Leaf274 TaxID=1736318 RepID=UPI0012E0E078